MLSANWGLRRSPFSTTVPHAKGLADEANALLKKQGVDVVFFDALTPKESDYTAILTKLKGANPDVVLFTGYYPEAGQLFLKEGYELEDTLYRWRRY